MANKRGIGNILTIFLLVILLLFLVFTMAISLSIGHKFIDEATPVFQSLGVVNGNGLPGDNISENAMTLIVPATTMLNSFNWILGGAYLFCLAMLVALAVTFRNTNERWLIGFYLLILVLAVMISISISNAYQDLYESDSFLGTELHDQPLISWLILYSPLITFVIMILTALIMFTTPREEGSVFS